jgi:hypothetical protein
MRKIFLPILVISMTLFLALEVSADCGDPCTGLLPSVCATTQGCTPAGGCAGTGYCFEILADPQLCETVGGCYSYDACLTHGISGSDCIGYLNPGDCEEMGFRWGCYWGSLCDGNPNYFNCNQITTQNACETVGAGQFSTCVWTAATCIGTQTGNCNVPEFSGVSAVNVGVATFLIGLVGGMFMQKKKN